MKNVDTLSLLCNNVWGNFTFLPKCESFLKLVLVIRKDAGSIKMSKKKRIKTALLAVICSAAAVFSTGGGAIFTQDYSARAEVLNPISETTGAQKSGEEMPDAPNSDNGNQDADSQTPDNGNQNPDSDNPGDPDGSKQDDNSDDPDDSKQDDNSDDSDEPKQDDNSDNPDDQKQEDQKQEDQKQEETVRVTASVKLAKNGKSADIKWNKNGAVSSYLIQRSSTKNGKYKTIARLKTSKRTFTDKKVTRGNSYAYRVAAKTKSGNLFYSKTCSFQCPIEPLSGVNLIRYSSSSIKVTWNQSKNKNTKWYKVYYAKSKSGNYKLAGKTKNDWYRVKGLKNNQDYYFGVKACTSKQNSGFDSKLSKVSRMKTMPYERTTIFAGDSITSGLTSYNILNEIAIGGHKNVVAAIGLNTTTFRTRRVFNGRSAVGSIVASKPYRVYIMLGDNDIHFRNKNDLIDGYREILRQIKSGSPNTDIVVLAVSPVTAGEVSKRSGFAQIPAYNQGLSALAKEMGVRYFDCTGFLKDSTGWLKSSYNAGDGVHWQPAAYHEYARRLTAYDKSLD